MPVPHRVPGSRVVEGDEVGQVSGRKRDPLERVCRGEGGGGLGRMMDSSREGPVEGRTDEGGERQADVRAVGGVVTRGQAAGQERYARPQHHLAAGLSRPSSRVAAAGLTCIQITNINILIFSSGLVLGGPSGEGVHRASCRQVDRPDGPPRERDPGPVSGISCGTNIFFDLLQAARARHVLRR